MKRALTSVLLTGTLIVTLALFGDATATARPGLNPLVAYDTTAGEWQAEAVVTKGLVRASRFTPAISGKLADVAVTVRKQCLQKCENLRVSVMRVDKSGAPDREVAHATLAWSDVPDAVVDGVAIVPEPTVVAMPHIQLQRGHQYALALSTSTNPDTQGRYGWLFEESPVALTYLSATLCGPWDVPQHYAAMFRVDVLK